MVDPRTQPLLSISPSLAPASAAGRLCARLSLGPHAFRRSEEPSLRCARFGQVDPISYILPGLLLSRHGPTAESEAGLSRPERIFHAKIGKASGLYPPLHAPTGRPPAEPTCSNAFPSTRLLFIRW